MSDPTDSTDPSLTTKADAAFRQAAAQVVRLARQTGTPVIVWDRDGVRAIPPDESLEKATSHSSTPAVPHPS